MIDVFCCDENRRRLVANQPQPAKLNGIDRIEVVDNEEPVLAERQRTLRVFFVLPPDNSLLQRLNAGVDVVRISGGERVASIQIDSAQWTGSFFQIHVTPRGDHASYTLRLTEKNSDAPMTGLDEPLTAITFRFKIECLSPFDCKVGVSCEQSAAPAPEINYLARDFTSFRQLILDRMSGLAPRWTERNPADLGITLVELLACVGDYLSYRQDVAATEAYLGTAQQRVSVRRHARLLDYAMHDGRNARVWVQVLLKKNAGMVRLARIWRGTSPAEKEPTPNQDAEPVRTRFLTRLERAPAMVAEKDYARLSAAGAVEVFEPLHDCDLFAAHNEMPFHDWGGSQCCLPAGATVATLRGSFPNLMAGDVLILAEKVGARSGSAADADKSRRQAVRLTSANTGISDPLVLDENGQPQELTRIIWHSHDALSFALTIRSVDDDGKLRDVSVAWGNVVLADHGRTLDLEKLPDVPEPNPVLAPVPLGGSCGHCVETAPRLVAPRYNPPLKLGPVTQASPYDHSAARVKSAAEQFALPLARLRPSVRLGDNRGMLWTPQLDLLSSDDFAPEFVPEAQNDGHASLRFGDDNNGMRPGPGAAFHARYRIGNGPQGNVGSDAIAHLVAPPLTDLDQEKFIDRVWNPLPAQGGLEAESLEEVKQYAPAALRTPQRCVTPEDYSQKAREFADVQRAAATLRWTGSWHTIFLTVDRINGRDVDESFESGLRSFLEPFRMAGHDLEIDGPRYVSVDLRLIVCVEPGYYRSDVQAALLRVFSAAHREGFFHPDRFTFGQPVMLSQIFAAAQAVPGVRHAEVVALQRQGEESNRALESGQLDIGRLEIARLANNANFPEHGVLKLTMKGGR